MELNIRSAPKHAVSPYLHMQFMEPLGTADSSVDAGWDYLHECWQPKLIDLVRSLGPRMVRFGGCFASYYHWMEAVGPMEERKAMLNLCWDGLYSNHVGTREVVDFCRQTGAEPFFVVNMESDGRMHWAYPRPGMDRFGTADEAAAWVNYCNDPDNALRRKHGDAAPYRVKYWEIGNETSYDKRGYDLKQTVDATRRFAKAMRGADPSVYLVGWGDSGWAKTMCEEAGDSFDALNFHHHFGSGLQKTGPYRDLLPDSPLYGTAYRKDPQKTWDHMMESWKGLRDHIGLMREAVEPYGKRLVMAEGHYAIPGRNRCEVLSSWIAGAAYARLENEIMRNSDILDIATMADFFGNRWQVNAIILPTPMTPSARPYLQPVGQVMRLYGNHEGKNAVEIEAPACVDAVATRDESRIYIHMMNPSMTDSVTVDLTVDGKPVNGITAYEIVPEDPTEEITELIPDLYEPVKREITGGRFRLSPAEVCALEISCEYANNSR